MDEGMYYKLAHENGWDFETGETINYRESIGHVVRVPKIYESGRKPDSLELRAFPDKDFNEGWIPYSAYCVFGTPMRHEGEAYYFDELEVIEEITDLDAFFGLKYSEVVDPINPFRDIAKQEITGDIIFLAGRWVSVLPLVHRTTQKMGLDPTFTHIWQAVGLPALLLIRDVVDCFRVPDRATSAYAMCYAYALSIFKDVVGRPSIDRQMDDVIFYMARNLWCKGIVPSHDGEKWRLHSGENAEIIWEASVPE